MAFNVTVYAPTGGADYTWSSLETAEGRVRANPDGTYSLTSLNPVGSFQDQNLGFPSDITAGNPLGLPGSPAFVPGDFVGERVSLYAETVTLHSGITGADRIVPDVVELVRLDYQSNPEPSFGGYSIIGYNSQGFVLQQIVNFVPLDQSAGTALGDLGTGRILFTPGLSLNTYDAAQNPIPGVTLGNLFGTNTTFYPVSDTSHMPPPLPGTPLIPCFASGARIATPDGWRAVEDLREGDAVLTADGSSRPVVWRGSRTVDCRRHPDPRAVWPVRIEAGAFGGAPTRALLLSPDHAVLAEGVLIPVKRLVNGATVRQVELDEITYHHIELPAHDVILAEGLPAETFLDTGGRAAFEGGPAMQLHPDFSTLRWEAEGYAPLVVVGPEVDRVRARLAEIAETLAPELRAA